MNSGIATIYSYRMYIYSVYSYSVFSKKSVLLYGVSTVVAISHKYSVLLVVYLS